MKIEMNVEAMVALAGAAQWPGKTMALRLEFDRAIATIRLFETFAAFQPGRVEVPAGGVADLLDALVDAVNELREKL